MRRSVIGTVIVVFIFVQSLTAQHFQTGSPEWLVDRFFRQSSFPDKQKYFIGEMSHEIKNQTIGEKLEGKAEVYFHQIHAATSDCVFAVEIFTDGQAIDFYSYLTKQNKSWKIRAVRSFQLPDFLFEVMDSLSNFGISTPSDSSLYKTINLFVLNDNEMNKYVNDNLTVLNEIVECFDKKENTEVDKRLNLLGCSAVFLDKNYPGCIFIQIASFKKTEAGFFHASESAKLPVISEKKFIYIEEVLTGWFVYRIM
jgi:hypothetical protein